MNIASELAESIRSTGARISTIHKPHMYGDVCDLNGRRIPLNMLFEVGFQLPPSSGADSYYHIHECFFDPAARELCNMITRNIRGTAAALQDMETEFVCNNVLDDSYPAGHSKYIDVVHTDIEENSLLWLSDARYSVLYTEGGKILLDRPLENEAHRGQAVSIYKTPNSAQTNRIEIISAQLRAYHPLETRYGDGIYVNCHSDSEYYTTIKCLFGMVFNHHFL